MNRNYDAIIALKSLLNLTARKYKSLWNSVNLMIHKNCSSWKISKRSIFEINPLPMQDFRTHECKSFLKITKKGTRK